MFQTLDAFGRKVAKDVTEAFPEWSDLATVEVSDGERAFVVSVMPPSRNVTYPLRIDTFGGEVTVSFEYYHAHFNEFADGTDHDAFSFAKKIISGQCAVVSYWRDDEWCGSLLQEQGTISTNNEEFPYANRIHIRSWTGVLDNDIKCIPRG